jgi:hypothetical protein
MGDHILWIFMQDELKSKASKKISLLSRNLLMVELTMEPCALPNTPSDQTAYSIEHTAS